MPNHRHSADNRESHLISYNQPGDPHYSQDDDESIREGARLAMQEGQITDRTLSDWWNRMRAAGRAQSPFDLLISVASLLVLRWLEEVEEEAAAIAEFEEGNYERCLIPSHRIATWKVIPVGRLGPYLDTVILPELESVRDTDYAPYANRLVTGLEVFASLEPTVQAELVDWISAITPSDPWGREGGHNLLSKLIDWTAKTDKSFGSEFLTPHDVARLIVKTADPRPNERVYDPCFGTGTLLAESANWKRSHSLKIDTELWGSMNRNGIYGRERNAFVFLVGLGRVVYEGIDLPRLELGDSLEADRAEGQPSSTFDCIVANLPFGQSVAKEVGAHYPIPMREGEGLFLQHIADALSPDGRAVVLVSPGFLSARGNSAKIRKHLIESNLIEAVIGLPAGVLKPYTSVSPSLLVLRKGRTRKTVRFSRLRARRTLNEGEDDWAYLEGIDEERWKEEFYYEQSYEEFAHLDFDLRVREEVATGNLLRITDLADRYPEVELVRLAELCQVIPGTTYRKEDTTDLREEMGDDAIGLLRISDLVKGEIRKPGLYLRSNAPQLDRLRSEVEPGDILLSIKGTIGKLALIPDLDTPIAATSGIAILRPVAPTFLREYLYQLLDSRVYRELLQGLSSGTTLQHVRKSDLEDLLIPVPPIQVQDYACHELIGTELDTFGTLEQILRGEEKNPFFEWLQNDPDIEKLIEVAAKESAKDRLATLEAAARSFQNIHRVVGEQPGKLSMEVAGDLNPWLQMLAESAGPLRYITKKDSITEKLSSLQLAYTRSIASRFILKDPGGLSRRAEKISTAYSDIVNEEIRSITNEQRVSIDCGDTVPRDKEGTATIDVYNMGPFSLTDVTITEKWTSEERKIAHWPSGDRVEIEVTLSPGEISDDDEFHPLTVSVEGDLPGGYDFYDEWPCPVYVEDSAPWLNKDASDSDEPSDKLDLTKELGTSPYNAGSPVNSDKMLYGRDPILRLVQRQLSAEDRPNVILLEGNRRTGKTSILKRLEKGDLLPDWEVIYCSLQNAEGSKNGVGIDTAEVWRTLTKHIGQGLIRSGYAIPLPGGGSLQSDKPLKIQFSRACREAFKTDYPFEIFQEFLEECLNIIRPKRLLLMLDEFDKLQEGIDSGVTSAQVPENLRNLIHDIPSFCAILTGSRRLKRLREEYWSALFGFGHREGVSALSLEAARALVVEPVAGRLIYTDDAVTEIVRLTAGHPFLIQSICNTIFETAAEDGARKIDLAKVKAAKKKFLDAEHFRHFWDMTGMADPGAQSSAPPEWRRKLILTLIQRGESGDDQTPMTLPLLEETLAKHKVPIPSGDFIGDDLSFLLEFEMIRLVDTHSNQHYSIEIPIFGDWIAQKEDFENTVKEAIREGERLI